MATQNPGTFQPSELATFLNGLADAAHNGAAARLRQAAAHFHNLATAPPKRYATISQREEIRRLCQCPLLSAGEKTRIGLASLRFDYDEAAECITSLQSIISQLEGMAAAV
jgi:hypothetical protein